MRTSAVSPAPTAPVQAALATDSESLEELADRAVARGPRAHLSFPTVQPAPVPAAPHAPAAPPHASVREAAAQVLAVESLDPKIDLDLGQPAPPAPVVVTPPPVPAKELTAIVDETIVRSATPKPVAATSGPRLMQLRPVWAATPARERVQHTLELLLPALRICAAGQTGREIAQLEIANDGHVTQVELLNGTFAETPAERCIQQMFHKAHFVRFTQPMYRVRFPFTLD